MKFRVSILFRTSTETL